MSIIDTLITDRTAADTAALEDLFAKARAGSLTEEEKAVLAVPAHKGAYNCTDLNRVSAALEYLRDRLEGYGYKVPGYQRIEVPHKTVAASKLPAGYTEAAYIESSGTQYIDTGFKPSGKAYRVAMRFRYTREYGLLSLFGNSTSSQFSITVYGSKPVFYVGTTSAISCGDQTSLNTDYELDVTANNGTLTAVWNGKKYTASYSGSLYTARNVLIFGSNSGSIAETGNGYRLYSFQIYDDGALVRDYIPCISADGSAGLYDLVEGEFYGNAGSGAFTSGAVVDQPVAPDDETRDPYLWYEDDIPAAAQMAQYIQNVGVICSVLAMLPTTPIVPADMEGLTTEEANAIEFILIDVQTLINNMVAAWFYSGDLYSGEV